MSTRVDVAKVEAQAKDIMDSFLKELAAVEDTHTFGLVREQQMRTPTHELVEETFRQAFLSNAPRVNEDFVIMEKKHW